MNRTQDLGKRTSLEHRNVGTVASRLNSSLNRTVSNLS